MKAEIVLVVLPGLGTLALDRQDFDRARKRGQEMLASASPVEPPGAAEEPLLDSVALARLLCVPTTWLEQAARDGRIPCVRLGRRVRFRRSQVEDAVQAARAGR
jgi:excisionase family DNA binding protein